MVVCGDANDTCVVELNSYGVATFMPRVASNALLAGERMMTRLGHELILGGQKSGKSRMAERRAAAWLTTPGNDALLIATALKGDGEMNERIERHRADRALRLPKLMTVEEPIELARAIREHSAASRLVLVDCLTLWLTNLMMPLNARTLDEKALQQSRDDLIVALEQSLGPVVLVSNEIGWGVSPCSSDARKFIDVLGSVHQAVASVCARVTLMVAGRALALSGGAL